MAQARCIATQSRPLSHDTKFVSRLNSLARPRERMLPHALAHSRPCRGLYRGHTTPCRGCGLAVSCPARCTSQPYLSQYSLLYCDSNLEKIRQSPSLLPVTVFFFFFFSFQLLENHSKKNIFFSFSSKPNKFIKIYFIYFSSSLTHCKTSEKKFFTSIFFFHLIMDYLSKIPQPPKVLISHMLFLKHTST